METERWLPVLGYENKYEVSDLGRVRSARLGRLLKPLPCVGGYAQVCLYSSGRDTGKFHLIHKLVLEAFVGPRPAGMQACHFPDQSGTNNRLSNLRWDTPKANAAERRSPGGRGGRPNLERYKELLRLSRSGRTQNDIAAIFGVSQPNISAMLGRARALESRHGLCLT